MIAKKIFLLRFQFLVRLNYSEGNNTDVEWANDDSLWLGVRWLATAINPIGLLFILAVASHRTPRRH